MTADFQTQIGGMPMKNGNYLLGFTVHIITLKTQIL